jgi:hypothetical protein
MKKIIILSIGTLAIVALAYIAITLSQKEKVSGDLSLIDFAIEDTASVDKIEIYDSYMNQEFTVKRDKSGVWVDIDGNCVQQEIPKIMLETFLKATLKGYVSQGATQNMYNLLMAKHKAVKIYQNGKWVKTWYVGHPTQDHNGTHMLLETPELKSDNPVIMSMKGFYGILEPRFHADPKKYQCSFMFSFERTDIEKIQLINRVEPHESYEIAHRNGDYIVTSNGVPLKGIVKDNLTFYLNGFKNIHFNQPNYTLSPDEITAMKNKPADYELSVSGKNSTYDLNLYRRLDPEASPDTLVYDQDYLWGILPQGEVVRLQYYVVGPLIEGQSVFVDKSVNN